MIHDKLPVVLAPVGLAGAALLLPPVGMPILLHGLAGLIVGGLGVAAAKAVIDPVTEKLSNSSGASPSTSPSPVAHVDISETDATDFGGLL